MRELRYSGYRYGAAVIWLWLALIFPVSAYLPDWVSFENGPVENAQVAVLLAFGVMCFYFGGQAAKIGGYRIWRPAGVIFWILAARELSWGRALMPIGYSETSGPILMASKDLPFYTEIHAAVGIMAAGSLYFIIRYTPWRRIFREIPFPWMNIAAAVVCMSLVTLGDHGSIYHTMRDQQIEELAELLLYVTLGYTAWYYYSWIENIK